jgi:hypothetical protein
MKYASYFLCDNVDFVLQQKCSKSGITFRTHTFETKSELNSPGDIKKYFIYKTVGIANLKH